MKIAEIEVSYRTKNKSKLKISDSNDAYEAFISNWNKDSIELQEEFKVLLMNRANEILGLYPLSKGGVAATIVDAKLLFSVALKCNAASVILAHNHPSGNLNPSTRDKEITKKLISASKFLDIAILDHLIISKSGFYSLADKEDM